MPSRSCNGSKTNWTPTASSTLTSCCLAAERAYCSVCFRATLVCPLVRGSGGHRTVGPMPRRWHCVRRSAAAVLPYKQSHTPMSTYVAKARCKREGKLQRESERVLRSR
jgi:hypothetical protein